MRRVAMALAVLGLVAMLAAPAEAGKRQKRKPAGVEGVVLNASCIGPCVQPQAPETVYSGAVTVTVQRASDGVQVASQVVDDGRFRIKLRRGTYDVSAVPPSPPVCEPRPQAEQICPPPCTPTKEIVCPAASAPTVIIAPCLTGETKRVEVRRHRFTHVDLHVSNICVA